MVTLTPAAVPRPVLLIEDNADVRDGLRLLLEEWGHWAADLIVLGTHGRSGVARAVLGSTAEAVVRHAPCPVVVVRGGVPAS